MSELDDIRQTWERSNASDTVRGWISWCPDHRRPERCDALGDGHFEDGTSHAFLLAFSCGLLVRTLAGPGCRNWKARRGLV